MFAFCPYLLRALQTKAGQLADCHGCRRFKLLLVVGRISARDQEFSNSGPTPDVVVSAVLHGCIARPHLMISQTPSVLPSFHGSILTQRVIFVLVTGLTLLGLDLDPTPNFTVTLPFLRLDCLITSLYANFSDIPISPTRTTYCTPTSGASRWRHASSRRKRRNLQMKALMKSVLDCWYNGSQRARCIAVIAF
jgi:hypothetical protein